LRPVLDFGVARIDEGFLRALDDLPWEKSRDGLVCAMQPGDYLLLVPRREDNGVTVRLTPFSVTDKETAVVQIVTEQQEASE